MIRWQAAGIDRRGPRRFPRATGSSAVLASAGRARRCTRSARAEEGAAGGARLGRVRVAYFPILYNLPFSVAHELGLWRARGYRIRAGAGAVRSAGDRRAPERGRRVRRAQLRQSWSTSRSGVGGTPSRSGSVLTRLTMNLVLHREVAAARGVSRASPLAERLRALAA